MNSLNNLTNFMYIDDNICMCNVKNETYLCLKSDDTIILKNLNSEICRTRASFYFENNTTLTLNKLDQRCIIYELNYNNNLYNGKIDVKFLAKYPYNATMNKLLIQLEYFAITPMY
jgi:hypothetical protein